MASRPYVRTGARRPICNIPVRRNTWPAITTGNCKQSNGIMDMNKEDWVKIGIFVSFVLGIGLVYGDIVGIGVLFLIIFIVLLAVLKLKLLKAK